MKGDHREERREPLDSERREGNEGRRRRKSRKQPHLMLLLTCLCGITMIRGHVRNLTARFWANLTTNGVVVVVLLSRVF